MNKEALAWYFYPEPKGKNYFKNDLKSKAIIEELFDYCQINLAIILDIGWAYLLNHYSYEELAAIDMRSGWFQPCSRLEFKEALEYQALISGYNPDTKQFGQYDEKLGTFS